MKIWKKWTSRKEDIFNSIWNPFEDRIRELVDRSVEVIWAAIQRGQWNGKCEKEEVQRAEWTHPEYM